MDCMDTKEFGRRFYSCPKFQVRKHKSLVRCVLNEINYFDLHLVFFSCCRGGVVINFCGMILRCVLGQSR